GLAVPRSLVFGLLDMHDGHGDMRLDDDEMSYEELLALEEHIGNETSGLSEETIMNNLHRVRYLSPRSAEVEPCCICQEEIVQQEEIGMLDCGHDFHTGCIKRWLMEKNVCPICKTTALVEMPDV
ncbi:E3 ubiquitin-protein ligase mbr2-like, partial [Thalictrum thalictroides]